MNIKIKWSFILLAGIALGTQSCKKEPLVIPPAVSEFIGTSPGSFFVSNAASSIFKIPVGISATSGVDRTLTYSVTSPTGAASGVQYSLAKTTLTIPAGKALDSIPVTGIFAGFPGSRKDTLVFTLTGGDGVLASSFASTYRLVMQKYCNVVLPDLAGVYNKAYDIDNADPAKPYGPYQVDVTSGTISGTTGFVLMDNFWDVGSQGIRVNLDWTSADNFKTTVPDQFLYVDPTYGNARIRGVGTGSFSSCDKTFSIRYEVYVSLGSFGTFVTNIAK